MCYSTTHFEVRIPRAAIRKPLFDGIVLGVCVALLGTELMAPSFARADAHEDAQLRSANPESPAMALWWEFGMHAMMGARVPLVRPSTTGVTLSVPALFSTYNHGNSTGVLPNAFWRGRVSVDVGYRFQLGTGDHATVWTPSLVLEHESDHWNEFTFFVNINSVSLRSASTWRWDTFDLTAIGNARLHVLTCTSDLEYCRDKDGAGGSQTAELSVEAVASGMFSATSAWRWFASVYATYVFPSGWAAEERRAIFEAGASLRAPSRGLYMFFAMLAVGDDSGALRGLRGVFEPGYGQVRPGVGFRWHY